MARAGQPTSPRTCWRDPRRHITAERRSEKLTRHRSHPMTAEYGIASFAARREARRLNVTRADGPKPPDAAKTRGVKEAISTSQLAGRIDDVCAARGGGRPSLLSGEPRLSVRGG